MTLKEYQQAVEPSKSFPDLIIRPSNYQQYGFKWGEVITNQPTLSWIYPALGLAGESGEVLEKLKKILRDKEGTISPEELIEIKKELGDALWYLTTLASELNLCLEDIATSNIEKFLDRRARGVTSGSGDNR